jgi:asparagine synthase (glutamine-hydrolysing)
MNRIAGILHLDNSMVQPATIDRMVASLQYHLSDPRQTWSDGSIALGCTRWGEAAAEDNEHLIVYTPGGKNRIAFDGRIDNRCELLTALKAQQGGSDQGISDTGLVLMAYEKWGPECPAHLTGDFAFAIWDHQERRFVCARDHFGVKPFYYSLSKNCFVFASTPLGILASGKVPLELNEARIADFLVSDLEGIDTTSSFYEGIFRLPPAHILIVRYEGLTERRYWQLTPRIYPASKSEDEYVEAFRELFSKAVHGCLKCEVPPGSMLSGGMDSSAIVGMARKILGEEGLPPLQTYAAISGDPEKNRETGNILAVIDQGQLQAHLISETELLRRMDDLVTAIENETEPFDNLMNLIRAVYWHARDDGVQVVLDGVQGDVLFSIAGHLPKLWRQGSYRTIIEETLKAEGVIAEYKMGRSLFYQSFLSAFTPFAPVWYQRLRQPIRYRNTFRAAPYIRNTIIGCEFADRARLGERFALLDSHNPRLHTFDYTELHKKVLEQPFITTGLERYERVAASFGIEPRHPFHDVRLVEFCIGLPWQLETRRGWTKVIMRRAMEPYLPPKVIWRKDKDNLMWEFSRLILKTKAEYFHQATMDEREILKPYVDIQKLERFWQDYLARGDEAHAEQLWSGIALAFWLRRHRNMVRDLKLGQSGKV